jgi:hypothetical protein
VLELYQLSNIRLLGSRRRSSQKACTLLSSPTTIIGVMWSRTTPVGSWLRRVTGPQVCPPLELLTYTTSTPFVAKLRLSVHDTYRSRVLGSVSAGSTAALRIAKKRKLSAGRILKAGCWACVMFMGADQVTPPFVDLVIWTVPVRLAPQCNIMKLYTVPSLATTG